ncbi:MAG: hypothetical protein H6744_16400 [Deltaproteobacteria bacterium]|nr:hypothetical protein [Deltaproteobacteria bacterium]MCB9788263.1 hypothetical protein [Deltaproteobacteria bacterium]
MGDTVVRVGQASAAGVDGRATTATAYGGFGTSHLLAVSDGVALGAAAVAAAQAAVTALLRAFRDDPRPGDLAARVGRAFGVAEAWTLRAAAEAGVARVPGAAGLELSALVLEPNALWLARLGRGTSWLIRGDVASPFESLSPEACDGLAEASAGDAVQGPGGRFSLQRVRVRLDTGDRLILASGATAANLPPDIIGSARASSPQLAAQRLLSAAGAASTDAAMALQILEVHQAAHHRPGRHREPVRGRWRRALGRLTRRGSAPDADLPPPTDEELLAEDAEVVRALLELADPASGARALGAHLDARLRAHGADGLERVARCLVDQRSPHAVAVVAHLLASRPRPLVRDFAVRLLPRLAV